MHSLTALLCSAVALSACAPSTAPVHPQTTVAPAGAAPTGTPAAAASADKTTPVRGPLYLLQGIGGNVLASAGADGVLLVDDDLARAVPGLLAAVRALGKGDPELVINTHWHSDHNGGNVKLAPAAHIIAHENVRKRRSSTQTFLGQQLVPLPAYALPIITFTDSLTVYFNGEEIRLLHFPKAHTDSDTIVLFTGSNVVHTGDLFFNAMFPLIEMTGGGNALGYADAVGRVLALIGDDTIVIPGHGEIAKRSDLVAYHDMLVETIKIVKDARAAGKSLDEIKKAGLPPQYAKWSSTDLVTTDMWIETIYKSLE